MRAPTAQAIITATLVTCLSSVMTNRQSAFAQETAQSGNKQVKILSPGVELVEVTASAEKCGKQKGATTRLRVTSEMPVDVRLYIQIAYKKWINKDFQNQKRGDEITDYMCDRKPNYKIFARAAGSDGEWPKP